jgi:hypothetical protein
MKKDEVAALENLIQRARRRMVCNTLLEEVGIALSVGLAGFLLLLVVGTQVLDFRWIAAVTLLTLAVGLYRTRKRIPSAYRVAQTLDRRMNAFDTLSTAWHYRYEPRWPAPPEWVEAQRSEALRIAAGIDARRAVPIGLPRSAYLTAALCIAALTLFGVRYGVRRSLDLRAPIAQFSFDFFSAGGRNAAARERNSAKLNQAVDESGQPVNEQGRPERPQAFPEGAYAVDPDESPDTPVLKKDRKNRQEGDDAGENSEGAERSSEASGDQDSDEDSAGQTGTPPTKSAKPPSKKLSEEESSLLQKMREAMANLLEKLKLNPPGGGEGERTQRASNSQASNGQKSNEGKGQQMPGKPQGDGRQEGKGESEQPAASDEPAQGGKSNKGERSGEERASKEARSGIGREDGDKSLREAENQAAMGKLSEILGKRSEKLTGEILVEVDSSRQQSLKTQYSTTRATHGDSGGEIHRDEVPLIHQEFVKQYFEEIRKAPPPKTAPASGVRP